MPDPMDVLRGGDTPVRPNRRFASLLRRQLERELTMTVTVETPRRLTPYLAVAGAGPALDWYRDVFGGRLRAEPIVMPDGRIGHAEIELAGGSVLMLSEEHPEAGVAAPAPGAGAAVTMHLEVPAVDPLLSRAVAAGADLERPAADHPYGRNAVIRDPFGHRWMISGPVAAPGRRHGDIGYASLWVPDADRAAAFFASVLGWTYAGVPAAGHARQVVGQALPHGIMSHDGPATLFLGYAVSDLDAALAAVRDHGGTAGSVTDEPFGRSAMCRDDQDVPFALHQPSEGVAPRSRPRPESTARPGDLGYITMGVADSARARAFYGAVLGWTFQPGRVEDGWQVDDVDPLVGLWGGTQPVTVPLYRVADLDGALDRVRAAGGTAGAAERMPYGRTSECADDQGIRFYLMEA